jgi:hypothetical protein
MDCPARSLLSAQGAEVAAAMAAVERTRKALRRMTFTPSSAIVTLLGSDRRKLRLCCPLAQEQGRNLVLELISMPFFAVRGLQRGAGLGFQDCTTCTGIISPYSRKTVSKIEYNKVFEADFPLIW